MANLQQKRTAAKSCAQQYAPSRVELSTFRIQAAFDPIWAEGQTQICQTVRPVYIQTPRFRISAKKWKSVVSINGFLSEVLIQGQFQTPTGQLRCWELLQNCRPGKCYSMYHPSEWLMHCSFKRFCKSKKNVVEKIVKKLFPHSMVVHHSALLCIATVHGNHKLENTIEIIALSSAVQKLSRKYGS